MQIFFLIIWNWDLQYFYVCRKVSSIMNYDMKDISRYRNPCRNWSTFYKNGFKTKQSISELPWPKYFIHVNISGYMYVWSALVAEYKYIDAFFFRRWIVTTMWAKSGVFYNAEDMVTCLRDQGWIGFHWELLVRQTELSSQLAPLEPPEPPSR